MLFRSLKLLFFFRYTSRTSSWSKRTAQEQKNADETLRRFYAMAYLRKGMQWLIEWQNEGELSYFFFSTVVRCSASDAELHVACPLLLAFFFFRSRFALICFYARTHSFTLHSDSHCLYPLLLHYPSPYYTIQPNRNKKKN